MADSSSAISARCRLSETKSLDYPNVHWHAFDSRHSMDSDAIQPAHTANRHDVGCDGVRRNRVVEVGGLLRTRRVRIRDGGCVSSQARVVGYAMRKRKVTTAAFLLLLFAYVALYVGLSRRGYAEAENFDFPGFYYFTPEDSDTWRYTNYGCVCLFWPLNKLDRALGYGRPPGSEPLWGLSK
jgi:hypothetical protein